MVVPPSSPWEAVVAESPLNAGLFFSSSLMMMMMESRVKFQSGRMSREKDDRSRCVGGHVVVLFGLACFGGQSVTKTNPSGGTIPQVRLSNIPGPLCTAVRTLEAGFSRVLMFILGV